MRRLTVLLTVLTFTGCMLLSCGDSGTGPDPNNGGNGGNGGSGTTTYSVDMTATPSEGGSVSASADGPYEEGESIELTAEANQEYRFTHWSGDVDSTADNPLSLTVDQDYSLTANFTKKSYELTINTEGEGAVVEQVVQQSKDYEHGTVVELTANPVDGWKFVEWQDALTGTTNPQQITVDQAKQVTAIFEKEQAKFYLADNGVTIKCENAAVGDSGTVDGVEYIKRTADQITTDNAHTTCTSGITDMSYLFDGADHFNGDITHWDVSEVTRMNRMFTGVDLFNQDISHWNVSSVQNMDKMFWLASDFNQDLSGWCVKRVGPTKPDDFDVGTHDDFEGNINKLPDWGAKCSGS